MIHYRILADEAAITNQLTVYMMLFSVWCNGITSKHCMHGIEDESFG